MQQRNAFCIRLLYDKHLIMKNVITLILLLISGSQLMNAQESPPIKHVLKTNAILTALGWLNVSYETPVSEKATFQISADLIFSDILETESAVGLGLGYRRYFTYKKKAIPEGFYIQPQLKTLFAGDDGFLGILGFELGYQWIWSSGFTMDLGLGPSIILGEEVDGIVPSATWTIGYAW